LDSQTHIEFALELMKSVGASPATAIAALFPQIDRHPPTLHRLYAHTVFKARSVTRFGVRFLSGAEMTPSEKSTFEHSRFQAESARFRSYLNRFQGSQVFAVALGEETAALLAYVSHLYLDTYNQPTQPFAPANVHCSGQWKLWEELGDFRLRLYTTSTIDHLRADLFAPALWDHWKGLRPEAILQAMMVRMCAFSEGKLPQGLVELGMKAVGLDRGEPTAVSKAVELLVEFEGELHGLHQKHLAGAADPAADGQGPLLAGQPR
jgi:hypothetical protein